MIPTSYLMRLAHDDAWVHAPVESAPAPAAPEPRDGEVRPSLGGGALGAWLRPLLPGAAPARA